MTKPISAMHEARRYDTRQKTEKVKSEVEAAIAAGELDLSISELVRRMGGKPSRTFIYENQLDAWIKARFREAAKKAGSRKRNEAEVSAASLRAEYENLKQIVRRQRRQIEVLELRLSEHLGAERLREVEVVGLAPDEAQAQRDRALAAEATVATLQERIDELEAELEAAKEHNEDLHRKHRELIQQINGRTMTPA